MRGTGRVSILAVTLGVLFGIALGLPDAKLQFGRAWHRCGQSAHTCPFEPKLNYGSAQHEGRAGTKSWFRYLAEQSDGIWMTAMQPLHAHQKNKKNTAFNWNTYIKRKTTINRNFNKNTRAKIIGKPAFNTFYKLPLLRKQQSFNIL